MSGIYPISHRTGWKVVLTPRVPALASAAVSPCFHDLVKSIPELQKDSQPPIAADFDWALHPGGSLIITGVEQAMDLTPEHLRASYEIYMKYGNSSSATIISVLNRLRESEGKERVIACAFGPGIALEMMVLRRQKKASSSANGSEENEVNGNSYHDGSAMHNGAASVNGAAQVNGNGISTQSISSQYEQLATNGAAIETALLSADGAAVNGIPEVNGSARADGANGSASSLPVEDLD